MPQSREIIFAVAVVLASLGLALGVLEGALRVWPPEWLRARVARLNVGDDTVGTDAVLPTKWRHGRLIGFTPFATALLSHNEYRHTVSFDEYGTRRTRGAPWDSARGVLILGDSFTFGVGVADDEAWPAVWSRATGRPVLNLAFPGATLTDELAIVAARYRELGSPPRVVFGMFLGNDLSEMADRQPAGMAPLTTAAPGWLATRLHRLNAWTHTNALGRSYVVQLVRTGGARLWRRTTGNTDLAFAIMRPGSPPVARATAALERAASALREQASSLGYTPEILLIPDRYQLHASLRHVQAKEYGLDERTLDPTLPARMVSEAMRPHGIAVRDVSACLARGGIAAYYVNDNHLTPGGQRRLAGCATDVLSSW